MVYLDKIVEVNVSKSNVDLEEHIYTLETSKPARSFAKTLNINQIYDKDDIYHVQPDVVNETSKEVIKKEEQNNTTTVETTVKIVISRRDTDHSDDIIKNLYPHLEVYIKDVLLVVLLIKNDPNGMEQIFDKQDNVLELFNKIDAKVANVY